MKQEAPDPQALRYLVDRLEYRPGWRVRLVDDLDRGQGSQGMTLIITTQGYDSYHPERGPEYRVNHYMPVPPAAFNPASWQRWLLEQFLLVERHEACEFFTLHDSPGSEHSVKPYAPNHGNGEDPYIIHDPTTDEARRTSFRNVLDDDGTGRRTVPAPIGPELAEELEGYPGKWVAIVDQQVEACGDAYEQVVQVMNSIGHTDIGAYLLFRVPRVAAGLGRL
jgi:hypothetical protein